MKYTENFKFESALDVVNFVHYLVYERHVLVHPDYPIVAVEGDDGLSAEEAEMYNGLMDEAFEFCDGNGIDIYHIGYDVMFGYLRGGNG